MPDLITLLVDGRPERVVEGSSVAAGSALGRSTFKRSVQDAPRGPLCGMGVCFECRVTIDGVPHRLACQTRCAPGMEIELDAAASD